MELFYYSAWFCTAIHIATSIPEYQTAAALAKLLSLPLETVEATLAALQALNLVTRKDRRWIFGASSSHLPKESPLILHHHQNWRVRALEDVKRPGSNGLHYTIVQSVSVEDFEKIRQLLLKTIDQYQQISMPSNPERLISFSCDLFEF